MKITVLAENTACRPEIGCEHGLSLFIETNGVSILFDTGQSELFSENADKLGIDLSKVKLAVLSHGHYDHGGGLKRFLEINRIAPIYISRYAFEPHYNGTEKYIGLDTELKDNKRFIFTGEEYKINDSLTLYSKNSCKIIRPLLSSGLNTLSDGKLIPEDFRHEQYLLIKKNGKRILISGCSHKGIFNIINWFNPDVLIGGFHFMKLPLDDTLAEYAKELASCPTELFTCHCTGVEQYEFMKPYMKNLNYIKTGMTFEI